jgi:nucleoside 2-deoxyribosyltransferase
MTDTTTAVYLAGPDVFHPRYAAIVAGRQGTCRAYGLTPVVPVDGEEAKTALDIYRSNVARLRRSHGVIANITPFRGPHCDVGTAWEIGYAAARGLAVFAFSAADEPLALRVPPGASPGVDRDGMAVEPFGLIENLMIVESLRDRVVHPTFEAAVAAAARVLAPRGPRPGE